MGEQRKHLINLHTSTSGNLPIGKLLLGEIAIDHSNVDDAKIFVETNSTNPSSATLATFVNQKYIDALYDEVMSGQTALAEIISNLADMVITGATGDEIITISSGATSNDLVINHKTGHETSGLKKVSTDEFGHVTASTEITSSEIIDLLVDNSGNTGEGAFVYNKAASSITYYDIIDDEQEFVALYDNMVSGATNHGSLVDAGLLSKVITEDEKVVSAALNKINDDIQELSGDVQEISQKEYLSASTPHITSITETEDASGKTTTINYFNGTTSDTKTIIQKYIIDCGEY